MARTRVDWIEKMIVDGKRVANVSEAEVDELRRRLGADRVAVGDDDLYGKFVVAVDRGDPEG